MDIRLLQMLLFGQFIILLFLISIFEIAHLSAIQLLLKSIVQNI